MNLACTKKSASRAIGISSALATSLTLAQGVFAQTAGSKGATGGALPDAGSTEITYLIFIGGVVLFVVGTLKLVLSFRE